MFNLHANVLTLLITIHLPLDLYLIIFKIAREFI